MADQLPARRGHKKSASTSSLAVMAGSNPLPDHAFRDLTNTRPEEREKSSRSRMTTAPGIGSGAKDTSAGMGYLPGLMSPRKLHREVELPSQPLSPVAKSSSSSRLARSANPRKSKLSSFTTSSASDTLHESTEEDDVPFLRPYTPQQRLAPADVPIPPSPAMPRSMTSSGLRSDLSDMAEDTPRSRHRASRTARDEPSKVQDGFRRSESAYAMTDTTASEVYTPMKSDRRRRLEESDTADTPRRRSSRRKSRKSRSLTVSIALETLLSLRASHSSRLSSLLYLEKSLAEACPAKLVSTVDPNSPLGTMIAYSLHTSLLALFGRHFSLLEQTSDQTAEQYLMEIEVALNVLQGLCMLELGLGEGERRCAMAMSCSWVFEALVDLLLLLRKSPYRPDLSLKVQLHCVSTIFILLLSSESNTQRFDDAGGVRALALVSKDGDDLDQSNEIWKQKKEIALKCLEVLYFLMLDPADKGKAGKGSSGASSAKLPLPSSSQPVKGVTPVPRYMADYMAQESPRVPASPRQEVSSRSNALPKSLQMRPDPPLPLPHGTQVTEQSIYMTSTTATTESNRSSSNSSSGTTLTSTSTESSILRTPHDSYLTDATSIYPSSRGYESERSEKATASGYLAPFAPSTPKKSSRSGMPKSSSSQGLGYWTPQVKSRVRHHAADLRDDQAPIQGGLSGLPSRRPSSSAGLRGNLDQVTEELPSPQKLFGEDLSQMLHSTTRSEAKGSSRGTDLGDQAHGLGLGMERSLAKAKERQERQEEARRAAAPSAPSSTGPPQRLPNSKSYIGLGMPGRVRSSRPPGSSERDAESADKSAGHPAGLGRMKKSSTSMGLSGYAL